MLKIFLKKIAYSISTPTLLVMFYTIGRFLLLRFVEAIIKTTLRFKNTDAKNVLKIFLGIWLTQYQCLFYLLYFILFVDLYSCLLLRPCGLSVRNLEVQ